MEKVSEKRGIDLSTLLEQWEHRYRITPAMLHSINEDGKIISASDAWLRKLGYSRDEVLGRLSSDFLTSESRLRAVGKILPEFFRTGRVENVEYQMVCKNGRIIDVLMSATIDENPFGQGQISLSVVTDVTALKAAERLLSESEARYRLLADLATDMVFQLDLNLVRQYVSPACREIVGYEPEEMIGVKPISMAHPDDVAELNLAFAALLGGAVARHSTTSRLRHRDGHWIWVEAELRALRDLQTGNISGIIGALRNISARKAVESELAEANRQLEILARQDALTGLANRRSFDEMLAREWKRAKREKTALGLMMIDIDFFKTFNDRYGHPAGDECLKQVSVAIASSVRRPGDLVARYGGEEFAVLLPRTSEAGVITIGERIRSTLRLAAIAHHNGLGGMVTTSIGAASHDYDVPEGAEALLADADRALYRAKECGRDIIIRASSLHDCP